MAKIKIERITRTEVEKEIPDVCPKCGSSFTLDGALLEDGWEASVQHCSLTPFEGTIEVGGYGAQENLGESIIVGYRCRECDYVIVSTEGGSHD